MTPKEKAKELVNKYFNKSYILYDDLTWMQAKECALIAVEEVIKQLHKSDKGYTLVDDIIYWNEVKSEIELL